MQHDVARCCTFSSFARLLGKEVLATNIQGRQRSYLQPLQYYKRKSEAHVHEKRYYEIESPAGPREDTVTVYLAQTGYDKGRILLFMIFQFQSQVVWENVLKKWCTNEAVVLCVHATDMRFVLGSLAQLGYSEKCNYLSITRSSVYA